MYVSLAHKWKLFYSLPGNLGRAGGSSGSFSVTSSMSLFIKLHALPALRHDVISFSVTVLGLIIATLPIET